MKISDPEKLNPHGIKNIIFDWGGVLTNLHFDRIETAFVNLGIVHIKDLFTHGDAVELGRKLEVAGISPAAFRNEIRKLSEQALSDAQIDAAWNSLLGDTPESRIAVVKRMREKYRVFLLSNTNVIHAEFYNKWLLENHNTNHRQLFNKAFYSHEMQLRKPDALIFERVLQQGNMKPSETLFVDDTEMHVDAADSLGIVAFHLKNEMDITEVFKDW
jgi:FMN phosphatase YigB (HAD superfamily)